MKIESVIEEITEKEKASGKLILNKQWVKEQMKEEIRKYWEVTGDACTINQTSEQQQNSPKRKSIQ